MTRMWISLTGDHASFLERAFSFENCMGTCISLIYFLNLWSVYWEISPSELLGSDR